jgi:hypothetical protein
MGQWIPARVVQFTGDREGQPYPAQWQQALHAPSIGLL